MFRNGETRFWTLLAAVGVASVAMDCGGPEAFRSHLSASGTGGSTVLGAAGNGGNTGTAGTGVSGPMGTAGDTPPISGTAGDTAGTAGSGAAGISAGTAGDGGSAGAGGASGAAGVAGMAGTSGTAGAAGSGAAGMAGAGMAGAGGTAGAGGAAGGAGAGGAGGAAGSGAAGAGGGGGAACTSCMLKVQYECRQNGASVLQAEYSIKVVNTGTTSIPLNNVSVRYWFTIDGTGAQAGVCASAAHPCTIAFQNPTANKPNADQDAVISFASGTLAPGADTGEVQITMHGTGNYTQTNDYSFSNTGANFLDEMHITGYIAGRLVWGAAP
jgi:hypothetical protein